MSIDFHNPSSLEEILSVDLQEFDEDTDDAEYEEKMQRLKEETLEFETKYPQFVATCEWCCGTFSLYDSRHGMEATKVNYSRFVERLRKRGWIVSPGEWDEVRERESINSNCFHRICHESFLLLFNAE